MRDFLHHRPFGPHRYAEIERGDADHPVLELNHQRLVEAEPVPLHVDGFLRDGAAVAAQLHLDDVARNDAQHEEHEHRHAEQRGDREQDAVDGIAQHLKVSPAARPCAGPRAMPLCVQPDLGEVLAEIVAWRHSPAHQRPCGSARCGTTTAAAAGSPARTAASRTPGSSPAVSSDRVRASGRHRACRARGPSSATGCPASGRSRDTCSAPGSDRP